MAFTNVVDTLVKAIPIGLNAETDRDYGQERREDLLDSTLLLFYKTNELLNCSNFSPADEESKDFLVIHTPTNEVLATLFKLTHSDKDYMIFTPEVYERIKKEEKFSAFVRNTKPNTQVPMTCDEALNGIEFFLKP